MLHTFPHAKSIIMSKTPLFGFVSEFILNNYNNYSPHHPSAPNKFDTIAAHDVDFPVTYIHSDIVVFTVLHIRIYIYV